MEEEKIPDINRLVVSSDLVKAYLINMFKSIAFVVAIAGAYLFSIYFLGYNPFLDALDAIGVSAGWALRGVIFIIAAYLVVVIFSVSSLASYELVFEGDDMTYSYGAFFKTTKSTAITNIIRVNFREYSPLKIGNLVLELTGTDDKTVVVQYVSRARERCELINKLISFKKSRQMEEFKDGVKE